MKFYEKNIVKGSLIVSRNSLEKIKENIKKQKYNLVDIMFLEKLLAFFLKVGTDAVEKKGKSTTEEWEKDKKEGAFLIELCHNISEKVVVPMKMNEKKIDTQHLDSLIEYLNEKIKEVKKQKPGKEIDLENFSKNVKNSLKEIKKDFN